MNRFVEELGLNEEQKLKLVAGVFASLDPPRLKVLSSKRKKLLISLEIVARQFEADRVYSESEVNDILRRIYPDFATLRRELVDFLFMDRTANGSEYKLR